LELERHGIGLACLLLPHHNRLIDWFRFLRIHLTQFVTQDRGSIHVREPPRGYLGGLVVARGTREAALLVGLGRDPRLRGASATWRFPQQGKGTRARPGFHAPTCVNLTAFFEANARSLPEARPRVKVACSSRLGRHNYEAIILRYLWIH